MTSWQENFKNIEWEKEFHPNDLDFETTLGSEAGIEDPNLKISTNEIIENCGDLFDLSTRADVETGQSDSDETLYDLTPSKKLEEEMPSDRYNIWKNIVFILSDRVIPRMELFENSLANFDSI